MSEHEALISNPVLPPSAKITKTKKPRYVK
jgi:hypothetical protein